MNKRLIIPILLVSIAVGQSNQDSLLTVKLSEIQIIEQVLDASTTIYGLNTGAAELNPFMKPLGLTGFLIVKGMTIYLVFRLREQYYSEKDRKIVNRNLKILNAYYLLIIINNIYQLAIIHGK